MQNSLYFSRHYATEFITLTSFDVINSEKSFDREFMTRQISPFYDKKAFFGCFVYDPLCYNKFFWNVCGPLFIEFVSNVLSEGCGASACPHRLPYMESESVFNLLCGLNNIWSEIAYGAVLLQAIHCTSYVYEWLTSSLLCLPECKLIKNNAQRNILDSLWSMKLEMRWETIISKGCSTRAPVFTTDPKERINNDVRDLPYLELDTSNSENRKPPKNVTTII